ncbi:MAG: restriction endonuclease, partial [Clostridia bacterium]|nr:restriction endonuclease [Clostridia bacterium]
TNQDRIRDFYKAKDLVIINWDKIEKLNERLKDIFSRIHHNIHPSIRVDDLDTFLSGIDTAFEIMRDNNIIPRLNNYGRLPEDVYYNWMRGYCVATYFTKAIANILGVEENAIHQIGMDNLDDIETFSQSPMADIEVRLLDGRSIRFEVQSGYTGVNDIKKHKVNEANRVFLTTEIRSYVIHFDLFNGRVAVVDISEIDEASANYIENERFEGQIVFSIPEIAFKYKLVDPVPMFDDIVFRDNNADMSLI